MKEISISMTVSGLKIKGKGSAWKYANCTVNILGNGLKINGKGKVYQLQWMAIYTQELSTKVSNMAKEDYRNTRVN